jgi:hypothetical protein
MLPTHIAYIPPSLPYLTARRYLTVFDRINTDKRVKAEPRLREVRLLSQSVSRHFIKLATDNRLLLVEALFSRNRQAQALVQSDYVDPAERRQEKKRQLKAEEDARQKARDARREKNRNGEDSEDEGEAEADLDNDTMAHRSRKLTEQDARAKEKERMAERKKGRDKAKKWTFHEDQRLKAKYRELKVREEKTKREGEGER